MKKFPVSPEFKFQATPEGCLMELSNLRLRIEELMIERSLAMQEGRTVPGTNDLTETNAQYQLLLGLKSVVQNEPNMHPFLFIRYVYKNIRIAEEESGERIHWLRHISFCISEHFVYHFN